MKAMGQNLTSERSRTCTIVIVNLEMVETVQTIDFSHGQSLGEDKLINLP